MRPAAFQQGMSQSLQDLSHADCRPDATELRSGNSLHITDVQMTATQVLDMQQHKLVNRWK